MIVKFCPRTGVQGGRAAYRRRQKSRRRLKRLLTGQTFVHPREVCVPGSMYRLWVLPPMTVHLFDVVRVCAVCESVIWRRGWRSQRTRSLDGGARAREGAKCLPAQHACWRGRKKVGVGEREEIKDDDEVLTLPVTRLNCAGELASVLCAKTELPRSVRFSLLDQSPSASFLRIHPSSFMFRPHTARRARLPPFACVVCAPRPTNQIRRLSPIAGSGIEPPLKGVSAFNLINILISLLPFHLHYLLFVR